MTTWLKRWLIAIVLLAAVVLLGGLLLPRQFSVERMTTVQVPPEKVYPLLADPRRWKDWTAWNKRDRSMQLSYGGPDSGVGATWAWRSETEGSGEMRFTAAEPPLRLAYELRFVDWDSRSIGELRLQPRGTGTEVRWLMQGDLGANPAMRWMGLLMDRMVGKDFELGLSGLKELAERG